MSVEDEVLYLRDDIYFCTGCRCFHDVKTDKPIRVTGIEYYTDEETGKRYKVKQPKSKKAKVTRGFGNPDLN